MASAVIACGRSEPAASPPPSVTSTTAPQPPAATPPAPTPPPPPPATPAIRIVTPVAFEQLLGLVPDYAGWNRSTPHGEEISLGAGAISRASAVYERGGVEINFEITDSGFNPLVLSPLAMSLTPGYNERSDAGYRRAEAVGGHPGFEEWHADIGRAEVTVVVGGRFVVHADGIGAPNADAVRALVRAVNLSTLASLR